MSELAGRLDAIWIKRAARGPMDAVERIRAVPERGLEANANQGGKRQVTLIEREVFDRLRDDLSPAVDPVQRRANLMVSGVRLAETRGRVAVGADGRRRVADASGVADPRGARDPRGPADPRSPGRSGGGGRH